ncbi:MAG: hypothetical protein QW275_00040 [Candidatus Anstonellaceae archaeon]
MKFCSGQAASEYLVVLGAVLIVSLVSISLIIEPRESQSDTKLAQVEASLRSASPIAFVNKPIARASESKLRIENRSTYMFLHMINTGNYPITITKMLANGKYIDTMWGWREMAQTPIRELYKNIAPGEEFYMGYSFFQWPDYETKSRGNFDFPDKNQQFSWQAPSTFDPGVAETTCKFDKYLYVKDFGFEYEVNIDGRVITKRQIWNELLVKCDEPFYWCC